MFATTPIARFQRGVTLLELALALGAMAVLASMAVGAYSAYKTRARTAQAVNDITFVQTAIGQYFLETQQYPTALSDVSASVGAMKDPWGNAYQYVDHATQPKGKWRKDKNIVPINSDYDVYSMGPDGNSVAPLTANPSRDDIVRANNGRFVGLASAYDP
jgi:general secretion pathway protein G